MKTAFVTGATAGIGQAAAAINRVAPHPQLAHA